MNRKILSLAAFSFFDAWLLSFAYEGQILYTLLDSFSVNPAQFTTWAILAHAVGLLLCGFFIKTIALARRCMLLSSVICIVGSCAFFLPPLRLWVIALITSSFFAGLWNASWGFFFQTASPPGARQGFAAAAIAGSTTLMVGLNILANHGYPQVGLAISVFFILLSLLCTLRLPVLEGMRSSSNPHTALGKLLVLLCLFIVTVTLSAGLMFQVINPAFAHLSGLTSWYWAIPYIATVIAVAMLPQMINRSHVLHISLAMIGFGFLAFVVLNHSAVGYLTVNTLLLGAFGITDLFWWGILGEMLEYRDNAALLLGIGLSVNVAGVLMGEFLSPLAAGSGQKNLPTYLSFAAVFVAIVLLPILYERLSKLGSNVSPQVVEAAVEDSVILPRAGLTQREREILTLLLRGYTYHLIQRELYISEGTVKTHIQNIFRKLGVHNRTDLIEKIVKKDSRPSAMDRL